MFRNTLSNIKRVCTFTFLPRIWRGHIVKCSPMKFQKLPAYLPPGRKYTNSNKEEEKCKRIINYVFGTGEFPAADLKGFPIYLESELAQLCTPQYHNPGGDTPKDKVKDSFMKIQAKKDTKCNDAADNQPQSGEELDKATVRATTMKQDEEELTQKIENIKEPSVVEAAETAEEAVPSLTPKPLSDRAPVLNYLSKKSGHPSIYSALLDETTTMKLMRNIMYKSSETRKRRRAIKVKPDTRNVGSSEAEGTKAANDRLLKDIEKFGVAQSTLKPEIRPIVEMNNIKTNYENPEYLFTVDTSGETPKLPKELGTELVDKTPVLKRHDTETQEEEEMNEEDEYNQGYYDQDPRWPPFNGPQQQCTALPSTCRPQIILYNGEGATSREPPRPIKPTRPKPLEDQSGSELDQPLPSENPLFPAKPESPLKPEDDPFTTPLRTQTHVMNSRTRHSIFARDIAIMGSSGDSGGEIPTESFPAILEENDNIARIPDDRTNQIALGPTLYYGAAFEEDDDLSFKVEHPLSATETLRLFAENTESSEAQSGELPGPPDNALDFEDGMEVKAPAAEPQWMVNPKPVQNSHPFNITPGWDPSVYNPQWQQSIPHYSAPDWNIAYQTQWIQHQMWDGGQIPQWYRTAQWEQMHGWNIQQPLQDTVATKQPAEEPAKEVKQVVTERATESKNLAKDQQKLQASTDNMEPIESESISRETADVLIKPAKKISHKNAHISNRATVRSVTEALVELRDAEIPQRRSFTLHTSSDMKTVPRTKNQAEELITISTPAKQEETETPKNKRDVSLLMKKIRAAYVNKGNTNVVNKEELETDRQKLRELEVAADILKAMQADLSQQTLKPDVHETYKVGNVDMKSKSKPEPVQESNAEVLARSYASSIPEKIQANLPATIGPLPLFQPEKDMPLSLLLKTVRLRNRLESYKAFLESVHTDCTLEMSKKCPASCPPPAKKNPCPPPCGPPKSDPCKKKKPKPSCPPPAPKCPPPPPKCPPPKPKCPPAKKNPCSKCLGTQTEFPFGLQDFLPSHSFLNLLPNMMVTKHSNDAQESTDDALRSIRSFNEVTKVMARGFEPWTPIPSWPVPKKPRKRLLLCPKDGCPAPGPLTDHQPCKPKEKPCKGFPKRDTFSDVRFPRNPSTISIDMGTI